MRVETFAYEFVDEIPPDLVEDTVYVSTPYAIALHLCACGCGIKVVTPLSPTDWSVVFNGVSVGLTPSIGNWSFPCRSHYWIKHGEVIWSEQWSDQRIQANRAADRAEKERGVFRATESQSPPHARRFPDLIARWFRRT